MVIERRVTVNGVQMYRDAEIPFFELKVCNTSELSYKKHYHEEYSLGIVDAGESQFWYEGKKFDIGPRSMVFIPPAVVHSCNPIHKERWEYKMLYINSQWLHQLLNSQQLEYRPVVRDIADTVDFQSITAMVESLCCSGDPLEKESCVAIVFDQALRTGIPVCGSASSRERAQLKAIREFLDANYLEKITLDQLERLSGLNKFTLLRLFKTEFSIPPHRYQTILRVNFAKRELRKERAIAEVAQEAGFYDQSHFHKVFKSHSGVTPEQYQTTRSIFYNTPDDCSGMLTK